MLAMNWVPLLRTRYAWLALGVAALLGGLALNILIAEPLTLAWCIGVAAGCLLLLMGGCVVAAVRKFHADWQTTRANEQRLIATLRSIGDGVISTDQEGRILLMNEVAQKLTGWSEADARGRAVLEVYRVVERTSREPVGEAVSRVLGGDAQCQRRANLLLLARDGPEHLISERTLPLTDRAGEVAGAVLVFADETERELGEAALRASQEIFSIITESVSDLIAITDLKGQPIYYSLSYRRVLQVEDGPWRGATMEDIHEEDRAGISAAFYQTMAGGQDARVEYRLRRRDGGLVYLEGVFSLIRDHRGQPDKVLVVSRDFSERHAAELALRAEKEFTDTLINAMPGIFYLSDSQRRLLRWNSNFEEATGYAADEIQGLDLLTFFLDEEKALIEQQTKQCLENGRAEFELHIRNRRGWATPHYVTGQRLLENGEPCMIGLGIEITARKAAEEAIRATMRRLERQNAALAEQAVHPALLGGEPHVAFRTITEASAKTLEVSRAAVWFFNEADDALICADLYDPRTRTHSAGAQMIVADYPMYFAAVQEDRTVAASYARTDPRTREFTASYLVPNDIHSLLDAPIRAGSKVVGIICHEHGGAPREWTLDEQNFASSMADLISISIEVGQRREAELALREARDNLEMKVAERTRDLEEANDRLKELDRLKSEFLATMSHELRTPLNSIIGFSGILQQGLTGPLNEEQKKQLGFVYSSAKHLLALINDLLDLSRVESGKMEIFRELTPIGEVVKSVVDSLAVLAQQKNLTLAVELDAPEVKLWIDRQKVTQILLNLVNNAIKFTEHGGVRIVTETTAEWLTLTVSDTGIGIERENLARLFEAFRQVDGSARRVHEGTGLGLYLSRQLVTLLGGGIWAESEFGAGSRFSFRLPRESSSTPSYERNDPPRGR
jgi:PAS domain S-box-containing protein